MSKTKPISFEKQLLTYLLIATLVPAVMLLITLWYFDVSKNLMVLIVLFLFCLIGFCASTLYQKITYQFRTLSNLLEGMTRGDYSLRGRMSKPDSALGQLVEQINSLSDTLMNQRFSAMESQLLVEKIIQHIDVAIVAINEDQLISLMNPAGEKLLNVKQAQVVGKPLASIGAELLLTVDKQQVLELEFANAKGQFQIIADSYREHGHQHQLFFITNVHGLLREHERQAWQNLIRVLSHEINNSLAPISSFASTLKSLAKKQSLEQSFADNLDTGLHVVSERALSLRQFVDSYRQLSHLPEPHKKMVQLAKVFERILPLFVKQTVKLSLSTDIKVPMDEVQVEQVLINLLKNAEEAMEKGKGVITIGAFVQDNHCYIEICDNGCGLSSDKNLFTPFYTTKKQGSGIGLVLCRQIIEAHKGYLSLVNRKETSGVIATIQLPLGIK